MSSTPYGSIFSFTKSAQQNATPEDDNYGMPSNWVPISAPPIDPNRPANPSPSFGNGSQFNSGPLPSNFGTQSPALIATGYPNTTAPIGLMPIYVGPQLNATIQSSVTKIVNDAIEAAPSPNTAGNGIQISSNDVVSVTNPVIHGDPIWEIDPGFVAYRDDFYLGTATASVGGGNTLGDLRWDAVEGSGASFYKISGFAPHWGQIRIDSGTTVSTNSCVFSPFGTAVGAGAPGGGCFQTAFPFMDYAGWKMIWIFGFPSSRNYTAASYFPLTKCAFYCGLATATGESANFAPNDVTARPPYFLGLRFDTDTTSPAISDSTFHFEVVSNNNFGTTRNNAQGTVVNTGIVPAENIYYRFEMSCTVAGQLKMSLTGDDGSNYSYTFSSVPTTSCVGQIGGGEFSFDLGNGIYQITQSNAASSSTSNMCWAVGSQVTISGATNPDFNQTITIGGDDVTSHWIAFVGGSASATEANSPGTQQGYPCLIPYFSWGNDTEATPVSKSIGLDFWSVLINGGLTGSAANSAKSRYF